jgi:ArsR family transcriptional regulator
MKNGTLDGSVSLVALFADASRVRLLALLEAHELTVAELTRVTELSQSRVSTHLGRLRDAGLLRDRREGTATYYRAAPDPPPAAAALWRAVRAQIADDRLDADAARCEALLAARADGASWAARHAGRLERHYSPGRTWESAARAFLALLELGEVCDVGCGDGTIAELLAPRARAVTAIDHDARLVAAARRRLAPHRHVQVDVGDMHALPVPDRSFDQVLLLQVLTHSAEPARVVREAARVCRRGGRVLVTTLAPHAHAAHAGAYGHVSAGHAPREVARWLRAAGCTVASCGVTSRERRAPHYEVVTAVGGRR